MSEAMRQNIFRCICGAERVYGDTGENVTLSVRTVTTRPKLRCSNPDHPGIHWHEYLRSDISTWKDYKGSDAVTGKAIMSENATRG